MADAVDMALDDIIKRNRASRSRGRGGPGRGGGRGGGRGRGRGAGRGRGRALSRPGTPAELRPQFSGRGRGKRSQSRSRSQSRARSLPRARSRSRQRRSNSRTSRSRSRLRALTPKGRAGLENEQLQRPIVIRGRNRGGIQNRLRRGNSVNRLGWQQKSQSIHSRLGVVTRRGAANQPLALPKRGISKRGRGLSTGNRYSAVGLRSDQILKQQRQNLLYRNNIIKSQTFRRSRNNSFNDISQLTVSVENEFVKKRRNSMGSNSYLNKKSLAQLNNQFGGYTPKRGPGSVRSMGSYRSNRSNNSNASGRSGRSRGRGRGRGVGKKFVSKQYLDSKLQKEIAVLQRKNKKDAPAHDTTIDSDFSPTPASTAQTLHQRFGM